MSREIRRKAIGMFVVEILFLVLLGGPSGSAPFHDADQSVTEKPERKQP